jgi:succinate-semialdehyde dehydrogenase/glutarate-semialdehyde dehydrogenase
MHWCGLLQRTIHQKTKRLQRWGNVWEHRGNGFLMSSTVSHALQSGKLSSALAVGVEQPSGEDLYLGHYINGQQVSSDSYYKVTDPANGQTVAFVADGDEQTIGAAVQAAKSAFASWRETSPQTRAGLLRRWYDLIIEKREALGRVITRENGKPLSEAIGEVRYAASFVEWFASEAPRVYGDVIPATSGPRQALVVREPLGVCAAITPWNFPSAMLTRKVAPALATGNTVVARPSELTPVSAIALAELAREAGIPAGVFNVISGSRPSLFGEGLAQHPDVRMLSFTGSTRVGRLLMSQCASTVKRTEMELGGLAPFIVFDDTDLDAAVAGLWAAKMRNSGQTCVCPNRIYVQRAIYDAFAERLAKRVSRAKVGPGVDSGVEVGPLINQAAIDKVQRHVQDAVQKGAKVLVGNRVLSELGPLFYEPTVVRDVPPDALLCREETFGPVLPLLVFDDEEEVIRAANATEFGLASYVYTRDLGRAFRCAKQLESGMVGVNEGVISNAAMPFGGVKQSGYGREGSKYGIDAYTNLKYILMGYGERST